MTASSTLSVNNWRTRRCHPAPSAVRMATSFWRPVARVSRRLATLAHAISSTSRHRAEQHQHRAAHVADDLIEQRHHADGERAVALVFVANARRRSR